MKRILLRRIGIIGVLGNRVKGAKLLERNDRACGPLFTHCPRSMAFSKVRTAPVRCLRVYLTGMCMIQAGLLFLTPLEEA
jgi:hypothetical protein